MIKKNIYLALGTAAYFAWHFFFVGLRSDHIILFVLVAALYMANGQARRLALGFAPFILFWILYDSLRVVPNYTLNPVHILEPYTLEKFLFGVNTAEGRVTLNEYFHAHAIPLLDVISGFFYLCWVPLPLSFAFWLFWNDKPLFVRFSYGFLFSVAIGFVIYYAYPAAPPWYVAQYGFDFKPVTLGNAAGLLRFDAFFGISLYANMYQKTSNIFAAIPSLHSAYPLLCLLYGWRLGKKWLNGLFAVFVLGIWFAAVYTSHHYLIDVLAGGATAVAGYLLFEYLSARPLIKKGLNTLLERV